MLLSSFSFTLFLALQCVDAVIIFRLGNASKSVSTIRDGTQPNARDAAKTGLVSDFDSPDAAGFTPSKCFSVRAKARPIVQLIANANALPEGPEKAKAIKAVNLARRTLTPLFFNPNGMAPMYQFPQQDLEGLAVRPVIPATPATPPTVTNPVIPPAAPKPQTVPRQATPPKIVPSKPTLNGGKGRRGTELLRMRLKELNWSLVSEFNNCLGYRLTMAMGSVSDGVIPEECPLHVRSKL
ncbi:hypothetical protein DL96DRAFT_1558325 [Flagelloscypha sp. PMI_526]|nr:hypothetical protein DL96DRAFT_1558325 [Flagelloscypha sp. PMI_526]